MRSWGAKDEETATTVPVHAIEVDAPADQVWPWLAQLGQDRGGFCSYCRGEPHDSPLYTAYCVALIELPHFLMERRMLLGIKERTERDAPQPPPGR